MIDLIEINLKTIESPEASCKGANSGSGRPNKYRAQLSLLDIAGGCSRSASQATYLLFRQGRSWTSRWRRRATPTTYPWSTSGARRSSTIPIRINITYSRPIPANFYVHSLRSASKFRIVSAWLWNTCCSVVDVPSSLLGTGRIDKNWISVRECWLLRFHVVHVSPRVYNARK